MLVKIVPELYVQNLDENLIFFVDILGFSIKYQRPEEQFVYLTRDGLDLMLEGVEGNSRKWLTGELEPPFGRGINFQWDVKGINVLYSRVQSIFSKAIFLPLEAKSYQVSGQLVTQEQFIVQSPDGYLFRFCEDVQ
ncbi:VOC family protein [Vibrio sp. SCSIO 43140]|uniref:bleomycin resistance protein n=1 Tax=Vibrio sp. SCSIO 43140 TaxID=2819100 RepID=UPI0020751A21|nr:VOC family protein [Vibrio sp. SCSIO 43140]USD63904.1 VOC family protein [Vibrio sp. SCSIO 43140]